MSVRVFCFPGDVLEFPAAAKTRPVDSGDAMDLDPVQGESADEEILLTLGPGLMQGRKEEIVAVQCGPLRHHKPNRWWIDSSQKRYIPALHDNVIGVIRARLGEAFLVDIGAAQNALLPYLSFENATKRNRPNLKVGQLIYARVCLANKDLEPELTCVNASTQKADGFGELKGGFLFSCPSSTCRRLLHPKNPVLVALAKQFPFEMAVGMNGRVWIHSDQPARTILVANAIQQTQRWMATEDSNVEEIRRVILTLSAHIRHSEE